MSAVQKVVIFGAHGKVGLYLSQKLAKLTSEFHPIAIYRNPEQKATFDKLNIQSEYLSLADADVKTITKLLVDVKADSIVFTAGAGGAGLDKTFAIDLDGAVKTFESAVDAKVDRYVIVSAYGADSRDHWHNSSIRPYYTAKHYADRLLRTFPLNYTILQPALLLDGPGTGKVTPPEKAVSSDAKKAIHREDVASFIIATLRDKKGTTFGQTVPLINGDVEIEGFY
ncbi:hypothetical protein AWJ20_4196 [Sugiyamaella lignohabitans]|uniref:NAD(P)-binding domain-containing protein n=1 Tax=Sugiyamaella lignohabitans TaxID=796027 RepID=A0A161HH70_9ASCO|nr:uncharacterized protein AWJ20_4196 [Sugiyamaella lignohabitans]ANB11387.1 hypothetical protein AWJ20_4196 [Sugiyamaella lignohabitans]